jgi:NADH-quinone oxidoreductase subunit J
VNDVVIGTGEAVVFWILGPLALAGALGMVFSRNAVHSALWLVTTMLSLGVFYVVQSAPFLGAVQIIVYTGAIMILFLFVLMLVGRDSSDSVVETLRGQRVAATVLGVGFAALVGAGIARATRDTPGTGLSDAQGGTGNIDTIAELLFTRYLLAFEVTSALLITAAVGAMVLAHIERARHRQVAEGALRARFLTDPPQTAARASSPGQLGGRPRAAARRPLPRTAATASSPAGRQMPAPPPRAARPRAGPRPRRPDTTERGDR